uniref:Ribonuclease P protein subunit p30 n=1 Tax=Steinernema glaseri TaxID=37863 RepID=A0A1I7Y1G7_9BILA
MKTKGPKPYLKTSLKFDWHTDQEPETFENVSAKLAEFLESKGFQRRRTLRRRKGAEEDEKPSTSEQPKKEPPEHNFACVGLRSVLRGMEARELKAVVMDSSILKPSALSTSLAFYATGCRSFCDVYAISGLDTSLAKSLAMKNVTAVGFKEPSEDVIAFLKTNLTPVGPQQEEGERKLAAVEMSTPIGKVGKKKRKRTRKSSS